jgi:hypothetical protein
MTETDDDGQKEVLYCEVLRKPPSSLSLIIGDCLHNLRSALDNLAFELALTEAQGPLAKEIEDNSAFPIQHVQTKKSKNNFERMTAGIPRKAKQAIADLQPYLRGEKYSTHPLWQLNELSRRDKHRLPPVASLVNLKSFTFFVPEGIETDDVKPLVTAFEDRAPLLSYPAFDKTGTEVKIDFMADFSIGFSHLVPKELLGRQIPELLKVIHWYIHNEVFPSLKPYLEKVDE